MCLSFRRSRNLGANELKGKKKRVRDWPSPCNCMCVCVCVCVHVSKEWSDAISTAIIPTPVCARGRQAAAAVLSTAAEELRATITVAAQNLDMALAQGSVVFALSLLFPKPRAIAAVHSLPATKTVFGLFEDTSSDDDYYW